MNPTEALRRLVANSDDPAGTMRRVKGEVKKVKRAGARHRRRRGLKGVAGG